MTLMGVVALTDLSIQQYPDITPPVVQVSASYIGADAESVNNSVAVPLTQEVMGVSDMLYMQTMSANDGSMTMQVTFDIGSSPDMDAIFTQNNVAAATSKLPEAVTKQGVVTRKSDTGFLMVYALASDGRYDDEFLSNYAYINLENRIAKINGVGKVSIMGAGEYAMRIWIKPDRLHYYGLSLDEVISAISSQSSVYPVGKFGAEPAPEDAIYTYTVTLPPQISSAEEFSRIIISLDNNGNEIRLENIADVALGSQTYGVKSLLGNSPSTMIVVYQEPGSNAVEVGGRVKEVIAELKERLPDGVNIYTVVDTTQNIEDGIKDIFHTLIIALVLVILIIYLFLQDWRATIIPLIAIPVSLIGTFTLFPLFGFTINIISLLGLVLSVGLVVDDAIVVVEASQAGIERGLSAKDAAAEAMRKVTSPIIATTLVLLAVFIPISFSGGISARLFQQFAITISVSVLFSMINALTLSPALCALLLRPQKRSEKGFFGLFNRLFNKAMGRYATAVANFVTRWKRSIVIVAVICVAVAVIIRLLPSGFLPEEDQGYFIISATLPDNTALAQTKQVMTKVDSLTKATLPVVASTGVVSGFNILSGIATTNSGVIFVKLVDYDKRKLSAMEAVARLNEVLYSGIPEAECAAFVSPSIPGLGVSSDVTLFVQDSGGKGIDNLYTESQMLLDALRKSPKIQSAATQFRSGVAQKHLNIDKQHALKSGVSLGDLYSETATLLGSRMINNFTLFGRQYRSYLQASPEYRENELSLESYYLTNNEGASIPLSSFVTIEDTVGVQYITQFNLRNAIGINATPSRGTSSGEAMAEIERIAEATLSRDCAIAWSGVSFQEQAESSKGILVFAIAFVFVFFTLSALYESWSLPIAIVLGVPLAVLGALSATGLAHIVEPKYINDIYLQISLVMLIGLAAKNSILVVEYADIMHRKQHLSPLDATIEAAKERVRPIIMTASASILGMLPLIFAMGVYSTARNIMGVALVGGLLFATLFGIFLYPALYYLIARNKKN